MSTVFGVRRKVVTSLAEPIIKKTGIKYYCKNCSQFIYITHWVKCRGGYKATLINDETMTVKNLYQCLKKSRGNPIDKSTMCKNCKDEHDKKIQTNVNNISLQQEIANAVEYSSSAHVCGYCHNIHALCDCEILNESEKNNPVEINFLSS